jgi:organic radical activating enzyme
MRVRAVFPAWGRILMGYRPFLSVEVTKECPLHCPGCYAYEFARLPNGHTIRDLKEFQGDKLVEGVLSLVRRSRPLHVSLVGGEPLIRKRELTGLIRHLADKRIEVQVVTSGVIPIPAEWADFPNLHLVVSVDGLKPEHDARRGPATYERILRNIAGHEVIIHCTILPQFLRDRNYLPEFAKIWSVRRNVRKIWFSLFTPQKGVASAERLTQEDRSAAISSIAALRTTYPKVHAPGAVLEGMRHPPPSPSECIFSQVTQCVAPDLITPILPCQIGGRPECTECGCMAAAGFACIGNYRLGGVLKLGDIFAVSRNFGQRVRSRSAPSRPPA